MVPAFNAEAFLHAAMASLCAQSLQDWEAIIVDDGSGDGTFALAQQWEQRDQRIRALRTPNGGASAARNRGYAQAHPASAYLMFLDVDDWLHEHALERMVDYLEAHPKVGLVACESWEVDAEGRMLGPVARSRWVDGRFLPRKLHPRDRETPFVAFYMVTGIGPFAVYRRSVYERTDGWDESLWGCNDVDMFCQMGLKAPCHLLPDRLYFKRTHPASLVHRPRRYDAYKMFRDKWERWEGDTPAEQALLDHARWWYRARHRPIRDLKVGLTCLLEQWIPKPNRMTWEWVCYLFRRGTADLAWGVRRRRVPRPPLG